MQTIKKDELFHNLGDFLRSKGIELNDGSYTTRIQQGCNLLAEAINATQTTVKQTKVKVDQALEKLRQSIHEGTAPKPPNQTKSNRKTKPHGRRPATSAKTQSRKVSPKA